MNYYAIAIAELEKPLDWRNVAVELAKRHPKAFCEACKCASGNTPLDAIRVALGDNPVANKIAAIKAYREASGAGLADAKNAVEAFIAQNTRIYS